MVNNSLKILFEMIICFITLILTLEETYSNSVNKETEDDIDEPEPDTTLFIKNINFNTTEEHITKV